MRHVLPLRTTYVPARVVRTPGATSTVLTGDGYEQGIRSGRRGITRHGGRKFAVPPQSTTITFPSCPRSANGAEALAVNEPGTIIAGHAWDRSGLLHAVRWTLQPDGSWAFTALPRPAGSTSAIARGVNNQGDVAGNDFPSTTSRAVLWLAPPGQLMLLDCPTDCGAPTVHGISAAAQVVVGGVRTGIAAVWRPASCREDLPPLVAGGSAAALAVNADGTIVGRRVRWSG